MRKTKLFSLLMALCLSIGTVFATDYELVSNASSLSDGDNIIIVNTDADQALSTTQNNNNRGKTSVSVVDGVITPDNNVQIITLEASSSNWKFNVGEDAYLYAASNSSNHLKTANAETAGDNGVWAIIIANTGVATVTAQGSNSRKLLQYNSGSSIFSCYATDKPQVAIKIFKEIKVVESAVTITNPTQGTISVKNGETTVNSGTSIAQGTELSVSIADVPGYRFTLNAYKTGDESTVVPITNGKITMPAYPITITADELALFNVAVAVNDANMGSATINGGTAAIYVDDDDEITLAAIPELGYEFVNWTVSDANIVLDKETSASTTALAGASGTITANFQVSASPSVVADPATLAFDNTDKGASIVAKSFTISGLNLTGALTVSSSNAVFGFEVTEGSLTPAAGAVEATIAVTPSTANAGIFAGNITISGGGLAEAVNVPVSITVMDLYTVSFSTGEGNPTQDPIKEAHGGVGITLPAGPIPACSIDDWEFAGWAEAAVASKTTDAPTLLAAGSNYKPASDRTLYAVYSKEESETEEASKTETFENQTAGQTYNSTQNYEAASSNAGIAWTMYYGTVSTNDKITGSKSAQMRWYNSATTTYGYIQNTTPISGLQEISFNAKVSNTDVKMSVWYSTDGTNWTLKENNLTFDAAATSTPFNSKINGTVGTDYYIRIGVGDGGTAPSSSSYKLIIDDIEFDYKTGTSTNYYLSAPTCSAKYDINIALGILNGTVEANKDKASEGDEVTLTANPETGYQLGEWIVKDENEDAVTVTNNKFTMPGSEVLVSATFTQINYTVTMAQTGGASATISDDQTNKHYGDEISISATAVDGYYFLGWEATPAVTFADAKALATTFTMPNSNVEVTAKYAEILTVAEAAALIDEDHSATHPNSVVEGYVAGDISFNSKYSSITYNIQAIDANGFLKGSTIKVYSGKGLNNADFSSAEDVKVGAKVRVLGELMWYSTDEVYEINYNNYQLSYDEGTYEGVEIYGSATTTTYDAGDEFSTAGLNAKDVWDNGYAEAIAYADVEWAADPTIILANTSSVAVTATYDDNTSAPYNVNVTVNTYAVTFDAPEYGTLVVKNGETPITSGDEFVKGTVLTVVATPESGYQLAALTAGGEDISSTKSFTIGTADVEVVATFSQATAIDNTEVDAKAVKVLRNGILLIEKNGHTYNAMGQLVK